MGRSQRQYRRQFDEQILWCVSYEAMSPGQGLRPRYHGTLIQPFPALVRHPL